MEEHRREYDVDAIIVIGEGVAERLTEMNGNTHGLGSGVTVLQAGGGCIETVNFRLREGLLPGHRVVSNGAAHIHHKFGFQTRPSQSGEVGHGVADIIEIFPHHAE